MKNSPEILWKKIGDSSGPDEVLEIMRGQSRAYSLMQGKQYHPCHRKLMTARNACPGFFAALNDRGGQ